jgi:hypothetical protein
MRSICSLLLALPLLGIVGCQVPGRTVLTGSGGRTAYNEVLQMTSSEQMLLNLVRLRYYDAPFFLDVETITTQFSYKSSASASLPIPGFSKENPFILGGEFMWSDQPTIQYTPLEGQAFAKQLLTPIDLSIVQQLIISGWDVDLVFRLIIQGVDDFLNVPEASGPIPEFVPRYNSFFEVSRLMRHFQLRSELKMGIKPHCSKKEGHEESGEGKQTLQIAFPKGSEEADQLAKLFSDVHVQNDHYVANIEMGFSCKGKIGIISRSIMSCMYYLSLGITVPEKDLMMGKVCVTKGLGGEIFDWKEIMENLITVHSSCQAPQNAYISVKYKNNWFYIDECDFQSKKTFLLLLQLYNLKAQEPKALPPFLTLPLG